jgi:glutamyl-tRNA reductase
VRRSTAIALGAVSISAVAVDVAARLTADLTACRALLIGAGTVARAVGHRLAEQRVARLIVANRSLGGARDLACDVGGRAVGLENLPSELRRADLVICATGAPSYVVSREMLASAAGARRGGLVVLDLAVPRDVDPAARELEGLALRDIDDVQRIAAVNLDQRRRELPRAWSIVRAEAARFQEWRAVLELEPMLSEVRRRVEQIRRAELERVSARGLDREQLVLLDEVTRSLIKKLLHEPTNRIRRAGATSEGRAQLEALCALTGFDGTDAPEQPGRPRLTVVA